MSRSKWEAEDGGAPVGLQVRMRELSPMWAPSSPPQLTPPHPLIPPLTAAALHVTDWSGMLLVDAALLVQLCPGVHMQQHTHAHRCRC